MEAYFIKNFREVLRKFEREIFYQNTSSCCEGISLAQCHNLLEIENKGKVTITELACCQSLDKSTISRTVDSLVKDGLVNREIPPENRRTTILSLTESGEKKCEEINAKNDQYIIESLSALTDTEKQEFLNLFEKVTDKMISTRISNYKDKSDLCSCE